MTRSPDIPRRELHSRISNGIDVRLYWNPPSDRLWVEVVDHRRLVCFEVQVRDRSRALDVFHHPYAYAAVDGIETGDGDTEPRQAVGARA